MKILMFDGNLTRDAEIKETPKGIRFLKFNVANTTYIKGENKTEFIDVSSFDINAIEHKTKFLTKGCRVFISGTPNQYNNVGKNGQIYTNTEVLAERIEILYMAKKDGAESAAAPAQSATAGEPSIPVSTSAPAQEPEVEVNIPVSEVPTADASDEDDLPF